MSPHLSAFAPDIWLASKQFTNEIGTVTSRMTVLKLNDGRLVMHAPVAPDAALHKEVTDLGEVAAIVAPNRFHHQFMAGGARSVGGREWSPAVSDAGIFATIAWASLAQVSPSWTYPLELRAHDPDAPFQEAGVAVKEGAFRAVGDRTGFRSWGRTSYANDDDWRSGRVGKKHRQDGGDD